jgi:hypothetical protein
MQEQPKVVDQEIEKMGDMQGASPEQLARLMQMLEARKQAEYDEFTGGAQPMPEEQGIGRLPAGNMDFAGGGIIAFADGGDVERYAGQYGSLTGEFSGFGDFDPERAAAIEASKETKQRLNKIKELEGKVAFLNNAAPSMAPKAQAELDALKAGVQQAAPAPNLNPSSTPDPRVTEASAVPAASAAKVERQALAPSGERASVTGGVSGIDALQKKYFGDFDTRKTELKGMREGLVQGIKDLTASNLADTQAEIAARGDVYKGREERLAKQEKDIEGMSDKYLGIALLQAGAAMMSTPGGLAAALGKGATVGAERYAAGLDKINAAQAKFAEAKDRLDDLRINRDDMNSKEIRAAKREAKAADLKGQELMLSGFEKDWGVERDMLGKIFTAANEDLQTTRKIQAQRETAGKQDTGEKMKASVFADLQAKYPNNPAKVAAEFNKTFAKTEDLEAYYRKQQLDKLAEAKVKNAGMPGGGIPGQTEKLDALERQLIGGGNQVKVASRADIAATAKSSGKTEQQVIEAMKARGYTIQ